MLMPSTGTTSAWQSDRCHKNFPSIVERPTTMQRPLNLMLFELSWTGHHAGYILHLMRYWCKHELPGCFNIVVAPEFVRQHSDVIDLAVKYSQWNIYFTTVTPEEFENLLPGNSTKNRAICAFQLLKLLCKYAARLDASHCLVTYFDSFQLSFAAGLKLPCTVSGIYFRPTFHYKYFANHSPSFKERIQHWRERILLSRTLSHSQFKTLFCLDPFVISHINKLCHNVRAIYLPDPVQEYDTSESELKSLRDELGISPERQVFLLFGRLEERKGIHQLLQAVSSLSPALSKKLCLLLVGPVAPNDKILIEPKIAEISQTLPVQIITLEKFIPDREIQPYFQLADVVLAPYQRHVGMSAILVRAAAAQKPVLTSDYGLMGEVTRQHHLGLAIDSTNPEEIAKGLKRFLLDLPDRFGDRDRMRLFAGANSAEQFASAIFQNLLGLCIF